MSPRTARTRRPILGAGLVLMLVLAGCSVTAYDQGRRALRDGRSADAVTHFQAALEAEVQPVLAQRGRAEALLQLDDPTDDQIDLAIDDLRAVLDRDPDDRTALFWLASAVTKKAQNYEATSPQDYTKAELFRESARIFAMYGDRASGKRTRGDVTMQIAWIEDQIDALAADSLATLDGAPASNSIAVLGCVTARDAEIQELTTDFDTETDLYLAQTSPEVLTDQLLQVSALDVVSAPVAQKVAERSTASLVVANEVRAPQGSSAIRYRVFTCMRRDGDDKLVLTGFVNSDDAGTVRMPTFEGGPDELHGLHFELAQAITEHLGVEVTRSEQLAMGRPVQRSFDLFLAYGEGLVARSAGDFEAAAQAFDRATTIDPGFGIAARRAALSRASTQVPSGGPVAVSPPPLPPSPVEIVNAQTTSELGLGLSPQEGTSEETVSDLGETADATTVRGQATVRVTGSTRGGNQ